MSIRFNVAALSDFDDALSWINL